MFAKLVVRCELNSTQHFEYLNNRLRLETSLPDLTKTEFRDRDINHQQTLTIQYLLEE